MQYNTLLTRIAADIYSNGAELITGDILQNVLNEMVGALASAGACYKGTITPASAAPLDLDQPTVYLALTAGTYTNFVDSNNDPIVTTGPALITYDGGAQLVFSKTDLPSGGSSATVIDTTGKNYLVFDWGAQNLGGSLLVTLKTSSGSRNRSLILDLDVYGDYVAKASDLDGAGELLGDTDFVYDNGTGVGYLTINSDVKGATLRLLSGTLPAISAESSAPEYYDPASVPVVPYGSNGKWGVISQTQDWSGSASTGYTYEMKNLVYGAIPQANIDLYTAAGASFNSTSGYFELNGLTDISYEEMKAIYAESFPLRNQLYLENALAGGLARTNFYVCYYPRNMYGSVGTVAEKLTGIAAYNYKIEIFAYAYMPNGGTGSKHIDNIQVAFNSYTWENSSKLKTILGVLNVDKCTSMYLTFGGCSTLETLDLYHLKVDVSFANSPNLTLTSIVYMVENAANTSAITITLHATAYARCQADTTEYSYGGNTYTGILALATAHNISIASA